MVKEETLQVRIDADSKKAEALYRKTGFCRDSSDFHKNTYGRLSRYANPGLMEKEAGVMELAMINKHEETD